MVEFTGKNAFVTGAGSGIGRASALALSKEGANVMIADIDSDGLEETASLLVSTGVKIVSQTLDVADPHAVATAIATMVSEFGSIDFAHNNAGIMGPIQPMVGYPLDIARKVFDVNVFGILHCMQSQIEQMLLTGGGSIVNTASVSGVHAVPNISVYTATKHAVIGLTRAAAVEYSGQGVRVNCVCPGFVLTNMTSGQFNDETEAVLAAEHPIGRFAQPEEIAEAVLWLLSDRASFSTGSAMFVDGGQTL